MYLFKAKELKSKAVDNNDTRFEWILIAKGIGMILVVIGHFYPITSPEYWGEMRKIIYSFHMPLFFLLSGYLYNSGKYSYSNLVVNKVQRLLYPFISVAVIFFIIKYIAGVYVPIEYPVSLDAIKALIINPANSYMPLLWFVHTLFIIFILYPLLRKVFNEVVILAIILGMNLIVGAEYYILKNVIAYIPFFIIGCILRDKKTVFESLLTKSYFIPLILVSIFVSIYLFQMQGGFGSYNYLMKFLLGVFGSLLIINISNILSNSKNLIIKKCLISVGVYSMSIYLFHTLFESAVRIGLSTKILHIVVPFELVAALAIILGVTFPLLLEKYFLSKNKITRKYILGISK